ASGHLDMPCHVSPLNQCDLTQIGGIVIKMWQLISELLDSHAPTTAALDWGGRDQSDAGEPMRSNRSRIARSHSARLSNGPRTTLSLSSTAYQPASRTR